MSHIMRKLGFHICENKGTDQFRGNLCFRYKDRTIHIRGVFKNNVDLFNNFTMLCSMVINVISICFLIFLPSFRRV